ncbi:MAG: hypothetical protein EOR84_03470 [Mesorhizobium sp.]|nr:MAG: hypothetical protein EOR84_03470 [Mesorhizobium sp.]
MDISRGNAFPRCYDLHAGTGCLFVRERSWILAKGDPHPNPPHKGEGTLPRLWHRMASKQFGGVSANGSLPPPCGEG